MKAHDLEIAKKLPGRLPTLLDQSLGHLGAHEIASFAYETLPGRAMTVLSAAHRGFVHVRIEFDPLPGSLSATFVPWKGVRATASHEVTAGQPGRWRARVFQADGPAVEVTVEAEERHEPEGWHEFLEALLDHANE